MKQVSLSVCFFLIALTAASQMKSDISANYFPTGFEAMANLDRLPFLYPPGTKKNRCVTYDAAGGNGFGFFQAMFKKYVDRNDEVVFFDAYGPGCLYRQQMNIWTDRGIGTKNKSIRIRYYFDDDPNPRIDVPIYEFFNGDHAPVTPPLAFRQKEQFGIVYYPFGFEKRLKITIVDTMLVRMVKDNIETSCNWHQFDYLTFPAGTKVKTWTPTAGDKYESIVRNQWENNGQDPKDTTGNQTVEKTIAIDAGKSAVIFDHKGQASITGLHFKLEPYKPEAFYNTFIRIEWDNLPAAVDLPISYFFGSGGIKDDKWNDTLKTLLFGFNGRDHTMYCYFPMPFWQQATIRLINRSAENINMYCKIDWKPVSAVDYPKEESGYFKTKLTTDFSTGGLTRKGFTKPYANAFSEQGHGHVISIQMWSGNFYEDGDEFTYIDDSHTPQIHGDGTEDDFNQGWAGNRYEKVIWGALENGVKGAYRIHLNEPYIFYKSIDMRFEYTNSVYGGNIPRKRYGTLNTDIETEFVVWYYHSPSGQSLYLTDNIDVGDPESEKGHAFKCTGKQELYETTQGYDSYESSGDYDVLTDHGRSFDQYCEFKANLTPDNKGVRLRSRINRLGNGIQTATVYVDGKKISVPWYVLTYSEQANRRDRSFDGWFDSEFEIPAVFTKGKKQVTIRIEHVQSVKKELNSAYYWVYCYE